MKPKAILRAPATWRAGKITTGIDEEVRQVKTYGKSVQLYSYGRHKVMEVPCRHFLGCKASVRAGDSFVVDVCLKGTDTVLSQFMVDGEASREYINNVFVVDGTVEVFATFQQRKAPFSRIEISVFCTDFENGLEEARALARSGASSTQISDQGPFSDQGRRARGQQYSEPYRPWDEDE